MNIEPSGKDGLGQAVKVERPPVCHLGALAPQKGRVFEVPALGLLPEGFDALIGDGVDLKLLACGLDQRLQAVKRSDVPYRREGSKAHFVLGFAHRFFSILSSRHAVAAFSAVRNVPTMTGCRSDST